MIYGVVICTYLSYLLSPFSVTEAAVLAGTVPFCSPLLECALLNPLLLLKLSSCNELNSFWLFQIRIFMDQAGRIPQKHISVSFELKHFCGRILLNGVKWKYLGPFAKGLFLAYPYSLVLLTSRIPGGEYQIIDPWVLCLLMPCSFTAWVLSLALYGSQILFTSLLIIWWWVHQQ